MFLSISHHLSSRQRFLPVRHTPQSTTGRLRRFHRQTRVLPARAFQHLRGWLASCPPAGPATLCDCLVLLALIFHLCCLSSQSLVEAFVDEPFSEDLVAGELSLVFLSDFLSVVLSSDVLSLSPLSDPLFDFPA